jgi:transposase
MPRTDRNNPKRGTASESRYSVMEFDRDFPDDAACLEWLLHHRYPNGVYCPTCQRITKHHREKARPSYSCQFCGHRVHPMVGTPFEGSATSLRLWFYGIYLMSSTRCGISAKQLERELGVTYKTAWRMFNKIRTLLTQEGDGPLQGIVEVDEAYLGGKAKWKSRGLPVGGGPYREKTPVIGLVQRATEDAPSALRASVAGGPSGPHLLPHVTKRVLPASTVFTDTAGMYRSLESLGYRHERVNHSANIYVSGDVHTNTIEGFWSLLKRGISGVYHGVSTEHLQAYVDEYVFRYNNREATGRGMFDAFLNRIDEASAPPAP